MGSLTSISAAIAILGVAWAVVRYLYHAANTLQNTTKIVNHMFTNAIPHIENALRRLCSKTGIDYEELPPPPLA